MRPFFDRGVALILVIFIVALASTIVVNLTYSTHLSSRRNGMVERGFQGEYLLKSAVNFARVLIQNDKTGEDSERDMWGKFVNGQPIPPDLLGIDQPNVKIELEIRPEESKLPLRQLMTVPSNPPDVKWRDALSRLFKNLGFDEDDIEVDHTGVFPGRHFMAEELVSLLIDYMDQDKEPYDPTKYNQPAFAMGVEGNETKNLFPNDRIQRLGELASIPGFTPMRLRKITPFITSFGNGRVNINTAPREVLKVLDEDFDDKISDSIVAFRESEDGPFTDQNKPTKLTEIVGDEKYRKIAPMIDIRGTSFQVLAKVEYDASTFFMRAYIQKGATGELPQIKSIELF